MNKKNLTPLYFLLWSWLIIGMGGCGFSPKLELDPESKEFYKTARLVMTDVEKDIFRHLPDQEARQEFIDDFWKKRDPDPHTEINEFKEEFHRRIEYANERFKEGISGWKTDRGRMYVFFGPPDKIESYPMLQNPDMKGYLLWVYYRYNFAVEFIDRGNNTYILDPYSGIYGSLTEAIVRAKFGLIYQKEGFPLNFMDFDLDYNGKTKEITISIPIKGLTFAEEEGLLSADFEFVFFIYSENSQIKREFQEFKHFEARQEELLAMEEMSFSFSFPLSSGEYYFDIIITGEPEIGKTRNLFKVKI